MKLFDWLGTLKSRNEDITSDALRIGQLEAALKTARDEAARAIVTAAIAQGKCERAQDQYDALLKSYEAILESKEYTTGVKRLAAIAKYRRGRA